MPKIIKNSRVLSALLLSSCIIITLPNAFCQPTSIPRSKFNFSATGYGDKEIAKVTGAYQAVKQGFGFTLWEGGQGMIGFVPAYFETGRLSEIGCEYPVNSGDEHLDHGGLWVGALVKTSKSGQPQFVKQVTKTDDMYMPSLRVYDWYTSPTDTGHPWRQASRSNQTVTNYCFNPQDTGAVSESDYYLEYTDTNWVPGFQNHWPLGIKILQRSYAWASALSDPILPMEYLIINVSKNQLRSIYVGFSVWPTVYSDLDLIGNANTGYWADLRTAHVSNPADRRSTPLGITVLDTPRPLDSPAYYSFRWFTYLELPIGHYPDYDIMSGAAFPGQPSIRPDQEIAPA
ncbi:MAG: hypothetical protein ABSF91_14580, partial [Bacteroidota bacterium]